LEHNHQAEEAADLFEQLANQPHLPPAVLRRVVRHLQAKDPQRAAHLAARHEQQNPEASLLAAQALHKGGQTEEALRALEAAHAAYPAHPGIFALLAELRLSQEPPEVVAEELQNLLSLAEHGPNLALRERLVQALRDSGQLQKAEAELWTCLQQAPNPHYFRANLAYVWRDLGRIDEALGLMEELLEENPNDRFVLNAYCKTCRDHDRAERGGGFIGLQAARDARLKRWWGTWKKVWGAAPE
jgi:tetratricopeptide (TPR) repeat protein